MTTIAQFSKAEDAHLLRLRLEAAGIAVFIQDENTVQVDWLLSDAIGGVRVQVGDEDVEAANLILFEDTEAPPEDCPMCPFCSSVHTTPDERPRRITVRAILLLGLPLLYPRHRWKCTSCGKSWNERTGLET
ncbi:hypothetical protein BH09VER1_BH09VER1_38730 [soil metagenome]